MCVFWSPQASAVQKETRWDARWEPLVLSIRLWAGAWARARAVAAGIPTAQKRTDSGHGLSQEAGPAVPSSRHLDRKVPCRRPGLLLGTGNVPEDIPKAHELVELKPRAILGNLAKHVKGSITKSFAGLLCTQQFKYLEHRRGVELGRERQSSLQSPVSQGTVTAASCSGGKPLFAGRRLVPGCALVTIQLTTWLSTPRNR